MFIYSVRASSIKFFLVIILSLSVLVGILAFGGAESVSASVVGVSFEGMKSDADRVAFIGKFGIEVDPTPTDTKEFTVPEDFDRIISGYNEIQKMQGLDLSKYKNKKVTRYTYTALSYKDYDGAVNVNLIIYKDTVIACDVSSADPKGFIKPLVSIA